MVSLKDVAKAAGLSISTVSKVLNNTADRVGISEKTQVRVREIAQQLNYQPNKEARNLRLGKRPRVILFLSLYEGRTDGEEGFFSHPFFGELMHYIQSEVSNHGFYLSYLAVSKDNLAMISELIQDRISGIVTWGIIPAKLLQILRASQLPVAAIEPYISDEADLHQIYVDNQVAVESAVEFLHKCGYQQIVMADTRLAGERQNPVFSERIEAFSRCKEQYKEHSLRIERYTRLRGASDISAGEILGERIFANLQDSVGVIAVNDLTALGVLHAAQKHKLDVPVQVGVIGIDDIEWARTHHPPLSTVHIPKRQLALEAVSYVANALNGKDTEPGIVRVPVKLIARETTTIL